MNGTPGSCAPNFDLNLKGRELKQRLSCIVASEHFIPLMKGDALYNTVDHEWISLRKLFCGDSSGEHAEGAYRRITVWACHQQDSTCMKLIKASAVRSEVGLHLIETVGCYLVEHQNFH
jgi:hypothetical protein